MPEQNDPDRPARAGSWRCWLLVRLVLVVVPIALAIGWWEWNTVVTIDPVARGPEWIAFVRRVDYAFPADADTSVYLARSLEDRSTWHRLAPVDGVRREIVFTWLAPRHLRVESPDLPVEGLVKAIDGVTIEWR